jgi:hypothetical protein
MEVILFSNPFIFWLPIGGCCRNLAIFFVKSKSGH